MSAIRCLCLDVDGVLTDGRLFVDEDGRVTRAYHIQDGLAIKAFRELVGEVVIVSGKGGGSIAHRAAELGIRHVAENSRDKLADLTRLLGPLGIELNAVAAMGDDLPDLPVLTRCGYPIAVANAVDEVRAAAKLVTVRRGGEGAVREAIEALLRADGLWDRTVESYLQSKVVEGR
jgi:3-deoxy-D-manno-octulosonate 8-phosphate phosphatase (KDO 8-P phosphatase)